MGPRTVQELMELLQGGPQGHRPRDPLREHALRTAALLRREHPSDKELQVAGLIHPLGGLLEPRRTQGRAALGAQAVRELLGDRIADLVALQAEVPGPPGPHPLSSTEGEDALTLRRACEGEPGLAPAAGVWEDWRPLLELLATGRESTGSP